MDPFSLVVGFVSGVAVMLAGERIGGPVATWIREHTRRRSSITVR